MNQWNNDNMSSTGSLMSTEGFGQSTSMQVHETGTTAIAEQAKAAVQARYVMAMQRPRNWDQVRVKMLGACKRPRFAETAIYRKPVGGSTIEGPSARFAEEALRCMGNLMPEVYSVYDDNEKVILRVSVTDLESNLTYTRDITVKKTVERRKVRGGQEVVSSRSNTNGQKVYVIRATEDDMMNKVNSLVSKTQRNLALMILPSDIKEDCLDQCYKTINDRAAQDPAFERKRIVDSFNSLGITPNDLVSFLGHSIERMVPAELKELRQIYAAISQGEARWADFEKYVEEETKASTTQSKTEKVKEKLLKKAQPDDQKKTTNPSNGKLDIEDNEDTTTISLHDQWKNVVDKAIESHSRSVVDKLHKKSGLPSDLSKGWDKSKKRFSLSLWRLIERHGLPDESTYETFNNLIAEEMKMLDDTDGAND